MSSTDDLIIALDLDADPGTVFDAILDVPGWWTGEIDGGAAHVGDRFTYRYGAMHRSVQLVTELDRGRRVVWHVEEGELAFTSARDEWVDTDIVFDLQPTDGGTRLVFTHRGVTPESECFDRCSPAWGHYIGTNLRERILLGRSALLPA